MRPVLLLHGALGSASQLTTLASRLNDEGRQVFTLNFSGHSGRAFKSEFGIDTFAADVVECLDANKIECADIFGYSMGGYVALWLAAMNNTRVNRIVTLGTKFDWDVASAQKEVSKMDPEKIQQKVPAFARLLESRHAPNDWRELMKKTATMMTSLGEKPLLHAGNISKIPHGVSVLLGDQDDMADRTFSEQIATALPSGKFALLPSTPHPIEKVDLSLLIPYLLE